MKLLKTIEGKEIKFTEAYIHIEVNPYIEGGYSHTLRIKGILPACRKAETFTQTFGGGKIIFTTLFGYRKWHSVEPALVLEFLKSLPVVAGGITTDRWTPTEEQITNARAYVEEICHCGAVTRWNETTKWYDKETN